MGHEPHVTRERMQELISARAKRLAQVTEQPRQLSPQLVARFVEQLLDVSIAYCGEELGKALYQRMLKDSRVRCGVCVDCGNKPAVRQGLMCAECQAAEEAAVEQVRAELAMELAPISEAVS